MNHLFTIITTELCGYIMAINDPLVLSVFSKLSTQCSVHCCIQELYHLCPDFLSSSFSVLGMKCNILAGLKSTHPSPIYIISSNLAQILERMMLVLVAVFPTINASRILKKILMHKFRHDFSDVFML